MKRQSKYIESELKEILENTSKGMLEGFAYIFVILCPASIADNSSSLSPGLSQNQRRKRVRRDSDSVSLPSSSPDPQEDLPDAVDVLRDLSLEDGVNDAKFLQQLQKLSLNTRPIERTPSSPFNLTPAETVYKREVLKVLQSIFTVPSPSPRTPSPLHLQTRPVSAPTQRAPPCFIRIPTTARASDHTTDHSIDDRTEGQINDDGMDDDRSSGRNSPEVSSSPSDIPGSSSIRNVIRLLAQAWKVM